MKGQKLSVFIGCILLFMFSSYIPNWVLKVTVNTYVGVAVLLGATLFFLKVDPVLSLAVFLAAGSLFLENRKRMVSKLEVAQDASAALEPGMKPAALSELDKDAPDIVDDEVHPAHESPETEEHGFHPEKESGSDEFHPVGESIDMKVPPTETIPSNSSQAVAHHLTRAGVL
jgi:hypothetical protein